MKKFILFTLGGILLWGGGILIGIGIQQNHEKSIPPKTIVKVKTDTLVIYDKTLIMKAYAQGWRTGANSVVGIINMQGGAVIHATPSNKKIQADYERDTTIYNLITHLQPNK